MKTKQRQIYEHNDNLKKCTCEDCGKEFFKGDEGDNERFCLRCCEISARQSHRSDGEDEGSWFPFLGDYE